MSGLTFMHRNLHIGTVQIKSTHMHRWIHTFFRALDLSWWCMELISLIWGWFTIALSSGCMFEYISYCKTYKVWICKPSWKTDTRWERLNIYCRYNYSLVILKAFHCANNGGRAKDKVKEWKTASYLCERVDHSHISCVGGSICIHATTPQWQGQKINK